MHYLICWGALNKFFLQITPNFFLRRGGAGALNGYAYVRAMSCRDDEMRSLICRSSLIHTPELTKNNMT